MFVIYHDETTRTHKAKSGRESWATEQSAAAEITRAKLDPAEWAIATVDNFRNNIELKVRRRNIRSGRWFTEPLNTPNCCSPASERYWCM